MKQAGVRLALELRDHEPRQFNAHCWTDSDDVAASGSLRADKIRSSPYPITAISAGSFLPAFAKNSAYADHNEIGGWVTASMSPTLPPQPQQLVHSLFGFLVGTYVSSPRSAARPPAVPH